jgi:hypothetical protein
MRKATSLPLAALCGAAGMAIAGLAIAGLAIAGLATASPAQAETWCLRDFSGDAPICVFPSARQCVAGVGAFGGVCERQSDVERMRSPRRAPGSGAENTSRRKPRASLPAVSDPNWL